METKTSNADQALQKPHLARAKKIPSKIPSLFPKRSIHFRRFSSIQERTKSSSLLSKLPAELHVSSSSTKLTKSPAIFAGLPPELRVAIWRATFEPRKVVLKRHSHRPRLDIKTGALLLLNKETHQIFLDHYTLILNEYGLPGIYFNHSLDTLSLDGHIKILRLLIKQYPKTMQRIERLETRNCLQLCEPSFGNIEFDSMPSLQSFAVKWRPKLDYTYRYCLEFRNFGQLPIITNAKNALAKSRLYTSQRMPQLLAVMSRERIICKTPAERAGVASIEDCFIIQGASSTSLRTFSAEIPAEWRRRRQKTPWEPKTLRVGWFPCELKRSSFVLKANAEEMCQASLL
ncbi:hypothetical protein V8E51_011208 [Hyaloscypha variabilis]